MNVTEILAARGGAARMAQLLDAGCTPFTVRRAVESGAVRRHGRGTYSLPSVGPDAVLATALGAGFTCVSALHRLELPLPAPPGIPHLAVPHNFSASAHRDAHARWHYRASRPTPGMCDTAAEALDVAGSCLNPTWHLIAVDAALNRGLITLGDVLGFRRSSRERREFLMTYADSRSEAPGETIARLRLVQAGIAVRPQAYIDGAGHVDLEVDGLLILQVDGYGPHSDKSSFKRDRVRGRAVIRAGRPALSYAASELLGYSTADVVGDVREALEAWEVRDRARVAPSGERVVRITRARSDVDPSGA